MYVGDCIEGKRENDWVLPPLEIIPSTLQEFSRENLLRPVMHQGYDGACVGFSGAVVLGDTPDYRGKINLSPSWIYQEGKRYDEWAGEDYSGTSIRGACEALRLEGALTDEEYAADQSVVDDFHQAQARKIHSYYRLPWHRVEEIKHLLLHESLWISLNTYQWFRDVGPSGIADLVKDMGPVLGGHAMALIGWKHIDGLLYWQFRNSWGDSWGNKGNVYIAHQMMLKATANRPIYIVVTKSEVVEKIVVAQKKLKGWKKVEFEIKKAIDKLRGKI